LIVQPWFAKDASLNCSTMTFTSFRIAEILLGLRFKVEHFRPINYPYALKTPE